MPKKPAAPFPSGPRSLGAEVERFQDRLVALGYAPLMVAAKVHFATQLVRWMESKHVPAAKLDEAGIAKALTSHRHPPARDRRTAMLQFLAHLRGEGVAQASQGKELTPAGILEQRYAGYLRNERGLVDVTLVYYLGFVRRFLEERFGRRAFKLDELSPRDVADFHLRHVRTIAPGRAKLMGTALRSFLRFLLLEGETAIELSRAIPRTREFRLASIPRHLPAEGVERVLASCNLATGVGRRDYAVMLLLARLGLRASEVVKLELDDIHWRAAELVVRGKGKVHDRLPLPKDVGTAMAQYLTKDRRACSSRRVFLRMRAPVQGFRGPSTISLIVEKAVARAGMKPSKRGAHLLRHSLATDMIRRGATMAEIGQVLRHRSPATTEVYAKVDFEGLRGVALAWPGSGGGR